MSRAGARTCFAALAARSCFVNSVNKTRQLTKHDLLEKGQKEGRGTAGLAAGVTSIAVAKEDVARMWRGGGHAKAGALNRRNSRPRHILATSSFATAMLVTPAANPAVPRPSFWPFSRRSCFVNWRVLLTELTKHDLAARAAKHVRAPARDIRLLGTSACFLPKS